MEITAGQSFPIGGHPTIEIATDSKRSLFSSIEAELQSSEVYQKVLESFKTALGEAGTKADSLLAAVGKEAIQLAFKKFAKKYRSELKALAKTNMSSNLEKGQQGDKLETKAKKEETEVEVVSSGGDEEKEKVEVVSSGGDEEKEKVEVVSSGGDEEKEKVEVVSSGGDEENSQKSKSTTELASTEETSNTVESSSTPTKGPDNNEKVEEVKKGSPKKKKKLTKAEKAALEKAQKRKEVLEQIGQELRKARIGRCLSLQQVHAQTLVPLNHLKALEKGNIEKLPEDIYIRGFIYRLGNALGLDGAGMAAALPVPEPLQGMIPSWSALDSNSNLGFELRPLHLYLGYTALMAGAVGGLTAVTQHSTPGVGLMPEFLNEEPEAIAQSNREIEVTVTPGLQFSDTGITVGSDMAPPEIMN